MTIKNDLKTAPTVHTIQWKFDAYVPAEDCCETFRDNYAKSFVVDRKHKRMFAYMGDVRTKDVMRIEYVTHCPHCGAEFYVEEKT